MWPRDFIRYIGMMVLFSTLSVISFLIFGHKRDVQSDLTLAAMVTILWAIRDGQKATTPDQTNEVTHG